MKVLRLPPKDANHAGVSHQIQADGVSGGSGWISDTSHSKSEGWAGCGNPSGRLDQWSRAPSSVCWARL